MKIRLLANVGYCGLGALAFPVEVRAIEDADGDVYVLGRELIQAGADADAFDESGAYYWASQWEAV